MSDHRGKPTTDATTMTIDPEQLARLEQAVRSLRRTDREIFLARRLDDMSYADIAQVTGLSIGQVERAMSRAIHGIGRYMRGVPRKRWRWPF